MQTRIQFDQPSTLSEWSDFKGMLSKMGGQKQPLLENASSAESLIFHLDRQLKGGALIKSGVAEIPVFPQKHFLNLVA